MTLTISAYAEKVLLSLKYNTLSSLCLIHTFFPSRNQSLTFPSLHTRIATNRGLFLARARCVCIHMIDEGDVSHLSRWGRVVERLERGKVRRG